MLESLAAWVLRTYVGEYVENLNTDQLSIGYGTVDLHNLPLKKTALKGLELPLEVKSGFIGHLQLSIPLRRPKSEPWIIHIDKLYLVAGPLQQSEFNEQEEKEREQIRKQKQLDDLESQWQASRSDTQGGFWSGSWWPSLYSSFSTTIVENLQLVISDVHIRYEDAAAEKSTVFAFGITIAKLAAQSTNENWDPEDVIQNERMVKYKLIDLQELGVYWDTDATLVGDLPSKDLESALHRMISRNQGSLSFSKHQYILEPISAQAKLRRNASALPLRTRSMPRFVVDVHMGKIPLRLAQEQYSTLMKLMEAFERDFRQRRYRRWRPTLPVKNNGRQWWRFAITCILHFIQERNKRHTWTFVVQRARDVTAYIKIYTQHLVTADLDSSQKQEQRRIEDEMTFEELASLRKIAMNKAKELIEIAKVKISPGGASEDAPGASATPQPPAAGDAPQGVPQGAAGSATPGSAAGGSWQGWLTGWYGWYSTPAGDSIDGSQGAGRPQSPLPFMGEPTTKEEEEFLDELAESHLNESIFNRDHVFANLNFHLESGSFKLMDSTFGNKKANLLPKPIVEIEFSDVKWNSEVRPRSGTWDFCLSLGAMYVRDKVTTGTLFPLLVSPQTKPLTVKKNTTGSVGVLAMSSTSLGLNILQDIAEPPLFEMNFEQLSPSNKTCYKLTVSTRSVSFVYNPQVFKRVSGFFSRSSSLRAQSLHIERQLMEAARLRYEELKNQTKAELIHTFDAMVEGSVVGYSKSWDIQLDIAAPQIVVPESFQDKKASVVILDFGHFAFANTPAINRQKKISQGEDLGEPDDSFVTPPSTPPSEEESSSEPPSVVNLTGELSNESLMASMYDRYTLNVSDIQMVVCRTTDKWADVLSQSFTTMDQHVVEKFTISLQLERRLIFTADPQFPSVTVSGKLPSLMLHINELKLQALVSCVNQLTGPKQEPPFQTISTRVLASSTPLPPVEEGDFEGSMDDLYYSMYTSNVNLDHESAASNIADNKQIDSSLQDKTRELMEESRLVLVQFSVDKVSLGVHARGCLIAELQVLGVKANYVKRPYDLSVSLGVHGLRLVDALQSYGPEYELLLSSFDRPKPDSVFASPTKGESTFTEAVTSAISAMAEIMRFPSSNTSLENPRDDLSTEQDSTLIGDPMNAMEGEDLILLEYQQLKADSPSAVTGGSLKIASLQINSLHVTANQETLVSLMTFFNEAFAPSLDSVSGTFQQASEEPSSVDSPQELVGDTAADALEMTATVHHIDMLLVRTVKANDRKECRKVADVIISNLTVQATFGDELFIDGALGGLRVGDLTPEGSLHKCVYTCGRPSDRNHFNEEVSEMWTLPEDNENGLADERAFSFTLVNPKKGTSSQRVIVETVSGLDIEASKIARNVQIKVHMASAQYVHTNRFLSELAMCAGDFVDYAREVGETLRDAAASVAMGLVSKKRALADGLDYLSSSFVAAAPTTDTGSRRQSFVGDDHNNDMFLVGDCEDGFLQHPAGRRVYACIIVESPIVSIPRTSTGAEMLVACLGQMTIRNTHLTEALEESDENNIVTVKEHDVDRVFVEIKDMSLNCLTLSSEETTRVSLGQSLTDSLMDEITRKPRTGDPILRETAFQLIVDRRSEVSPQFETPNNGKPTIQLTGKVISPLMLELSTQTYRHLFATIDSLTGDKEHGMGASAQTKPDIVGTSSFEAGHSPPPASPTTLGQEGSLLAHVKKASLEPTKQKGWEIKTNEPPPPQPGTPHQETEDKENDPTPVKAFLEVPHFSIKLCGELNRVEHEIVDIMFKDFSLSFDHSEPTLTHFDITLGGLLVEDLLQEPNSFYRHLMASAVPLRDQFKHRSLSASPALSSSCPTVSNCGLSSNLSSSLPLYFPSSPKAGAFRTLSPLRPLFKSSRSPSMSAIATIAESTRTSLEDIRSVSGSKQKKQAEVLVHVKALFVDKNSPEFVSKYNKVNRFLDIDFNALDTTVNLQTWVMLLEFFGIGVPNPPPSQPTSPLSSEGPQDWKSTSGADEPEKMNVSSEEEPHEDVNTKVTLQVSSLSLTLNKTQYPLAKAKVMGLATQIEMNNGNFAAKGKLAAISVTDMSPHGALYREKFTTCGEEALSFDFFRYGEPDPEEMREWDLSLTLNMSSVQYVHTKRFQTELVAFGQHFIQLQEVLGRMRAASEGSEVREIVGRSARVLLDIKAGNPVILIPRSSKSCDMLVADLGDLALVNSFIHEGDLGTLFHKQMLKRARTGSTASTASADMEVDGDAMLKTCLLLDCMQLELVDMDLFSAVRVPVSGQQNTSAFTYKRQGIKLLNEKCKLSLCVERNLDWAFSRKAPDFQFSGRLSSVCASLDYSQYGLILGLLGENLGEPLEQFEKPSSVLQDPLEQLTESEEVWTVLKMCIELVNVSVELLPIRLFGHPDHESEQLPPSLARIDFIKSKLEFENFSDWSKTIDLVSQEVIFEDTRHQDLNDSEVRVFTEVLLPRRSSSSAREHESSLQFEVHYRDSLRSTLLTFLVNHSRIMLIMDYILDTYNFIMGRMFRDDGESRRAEEAAAQLAEQNEEPPPPVSPAVTGVVTKLDMQNLPETQPKTFEMKVNLSGTEFVLLDNLDTADTNAVVLKITAVLAWRPHLQSQKWLSCSIQSLEVFSCIFSCEEDSALSIIDPMSALVELNNARRPTARRTAGLLDIAGERLPSVEISLQTALNMRISYNDYKLYLTIFESVSRQLNKAIKTEQELKNVPEEVTQQEYDESLIWRLQELGFKKEDCVRALQSTSGRLDASATWLLENATPILQQQSAVQDGGWQFAGFEVRAGSVGVCLIDDCGDNDVPLMEMSAHGIYFWHDLQSTGDGAAHGTLTVEYYNRSVSGWEPFVEPWKCHLHWQKQHKTLAIPERFLIKLDAPDRLDITVTTTLINMIKQTADSWSEDYYGPNRAPNSALSGGTGAPASAPSSDGSRKSSFDRSISIDSFGSPVHRPESGVSMFSEGSSHFRRRVPFVPYILRNHTGCVLSFATITSTPSKVIMTNTGLTLSGRANPTSGAQQGKMSQWREVLSGAEAPFEFSSREKLRHRDTHEFKVCQIVVQVEGWDQVSPVSVDRVGTFFRQAQPVRDHLEASSMGSDVQPVRVVFEVTLEGGARKVVTVRSALVIRNKLDVPADIRMQPPLSSQTPQVLPTLPSQSTVAIPLPCLMWQLYIQPHSHGVGFSSEPLEWKEVLKSHTTHDYTRECYSSATGSRKFRFCVAAKREGYPEDVPPQMNPDVVQSKRVKLSPQPSHTLTLMPPLTLVNLLPCDMSYRIKSVACMGTIRAGKSVPIYSVNTDRALDMGLCIENFSYCDNIRIARRQPGMIEYPLIHVELQDPKRRSLTVICKVTVRPGGSLRIAICAPYWMVNNTGIPLIFKQDGVPYDNAGQFDEHEMARSLTPLLFSFADRDAPYRCQMRVGKAYRPVSGRPVWSNPFSLDSPREFRQIHARQGHGRPDKRLTKVPPPLDPSGAKVPICVVSRRVIYHEQAGCEFDTRSEHGVRLNTAKDWVYDIGIDVRFGKGRYRDTRIVTFATRYQLENKTQHTLAFSQRHFVRDQGTRNPDGTLTALPGALVLFHWARTDLDQLLCIRLNDVSHCQWSGGFRIDRDDSFHINMRSLNGFSLFVRVEVMLRGATYHVLFTDASQLPPPFRIDNMSEVAIKFFQTGTEDRLRTTLQPKQSVPYSWDEPTLLPELSVGVSNESSYVRYNMNSLGPGERLYYYNPICIVFTHTFTSVDGHVCGSVHVQQATSGNQSFNMRELVLDVPQGTAVLLRRKEPHKRTQLWRMTGEGLLRHEGSSPPSDPRKPSSAVSGLVLDIDSLAPPTMGKYVKLVLSKPNPHRRHSQTWSFSEDGRMKCGLPGLYVQSPAGVKGLKNGADAVLGPANITKEDHIPIEQCVGTQKMRPGSGCLAVKVVPDGPTRVLHIADSFHQTDEESSEKDWMLVEQKGGLRQTTVSSLGTEPDSSELEVQVRLAGGIGVSVINAVPEELVFASLEQIEIDYMRTCKTEGFEANIGRIQIDNQLYGSQAAVLLFATPIEKGSKEELMPSQPAVHLTASREPTKLQNVEIYKNLEISVRKMTVQLDEVLLLKLLQFFGYVIHDDDATTANEEDDESLYDNQRSSIANTAPSAKRFYFERLQLNSTQLKISLGTVGRLPDDLQALKSSLGLILVNLEDATVDLEAFSRSHPFETMSFFLDTVSKHYTEELRSQAAAIVGAVDFLGNPMGLFNDVSSGLEGLVKRGNVGGLFLNVAHGVSDSAAKITGSLSDGLWSASMDSKNQESRDAMRAERFGSSREHFVAGVKGLGMGLFGGLTSIVTQPFEGAQRKGVPGFVTGIGKGIVGTFAKPAAGVLDFASGTAAAVRGQATRSSRYYQPKPVRLRRNCFGPSGAIPPFSSTHAEGQEIMLKLNEYNLSERFVLSETVRRDREDRLKAIITTEGVYFVRAKGTPSPEAIVLLVKFCDLFECQVLPSDDKHYIELVRKADNSLEPTPSKNPGKRPRVRCDTSTVAQKVAQKINYTKGLYDEVQQTVKLEAEEDAAPT